MSVEPEPEPESDTQERDPMLFTMEEYRSIVELAHETTSLIFWTRNTQGDIQPLLMPVDPAWMMSH